MKPMKETLRYKNMVANLKSRPLYVKETALLKEIAGGKQWRMDAVMDAIGKEQKDWFALTNRSGFPEYMVRKVLEQAATFGRLETMQTLCKRMSYELTAPDQPVAFRHAVHRAYEYAVINGHYKVADYLAKNCGARPDRDMENAPSAMTIALAEGSKKKIDLLIGNEADLSFALYRAVSRSSKEIIEHLINKGADVNYQRGHYWSPFFAAVAEKRNDIAHYLLSRGAEPQKNPSAREAIKTCIDYKNVEMIKTLLKIGIQPNAYDLASAQRVGVKEIIDLIEPLVVKKDTPQAPKPV